MRTRVVCPLLFFAGIVLLSTTSFAQVGAPTVAPPELRTQGSPFGHHLCCVA
jgi:hypothetical protein